MKNLSRPALIYWALTKGSNSPRLTRAGALAVKTGPCTGRSPEAKYIVKDEVTLKLVDWENNQSMESEEFEQYYEDFHQAAQSRVFYEQDLFAGYDKNHRLPIRVHTIKPWHALFAKNMFFNPSAEELQGFEPEFEIYSMPSFSEEPKVIISLKEKVILISGTDYAGEIKKSVFTVLNFILPQKNILPMHCSVNVPTHQGSAASTVFFGLSGTGKTTLSSDEEAFLVGDDEHGWSDEGLFNFEGGCYAKIIRLSEKDEPLIYDACHRFGTILENVILENSEPDFDNGALTENTRASYPLEFVGNKWAEPSCDHPNNIIMLTCDAYGILPPVARLDPDKAVEQFLLGYTAKIAGTEEGIKDPEPTFSHCFGSPFMPLRPKVYADLLREKIEEHGVNCWLVNTGWTGGPYGLGNRISISMTRKIIDGIQYGLFLEEKCVYQRHLYTDLEIPVLPGFLPEDILFPENGWPSKKEYEKSANKLMSKFILRLKTMTL
tara:strand:- start:3788 stop:5263 length:1476 start_codon:yes stop_codon:yes gene_type:complete